jgi:hypothetical protein
MSQNAYTVIPRLLVLGVLVRKLLPRPVGHVSHR